MRLVGLLAAVALLTGSCGASAQVDRAGETEGGDPLYQGAGTVLEDGSHGPMLCFLVAESDPPQCGDIPLAGWDWARVDGEQTRLGTTWGDGYRVRGRYDGETLTVVSVDAAPPPRIDPSDAHEFRPACEEPEGGWLALWPGDDEWLYAAGHLAERKPEYVASWVTNLDPSVDPTGEQPIPYLLNVVFSSRAAEYEAELRDRFDGPLCVLEREVPTEREARAIAKEAERTLAGLGLKVMMVAPGGVQPSVDLEVIADPGGRGQATLDDLYGPGVVRVTALLEAVP